MNKLDFSKLSIFDFKFQSGLQEEESTFNKLKDSADHLNHDYSRFLKLKTEGKHSSDSEEPLKTPDQVCEDLDRDLGTNSDDDEEGTSEDLSPTKSPSSRKMNSVLQFSSPRFEGVSWKKKFGSFMSESGHHFDQDPARKRISLLDIVNEARTKKRNSDIYGTKPQKLMLNKLSRKSMFDLIQRSSLKLGKDISIIKTISTKVENSHSSEFHTPRSSFSGVNIPKPMSFGLHLNEVQIGDDIKSEEEGSEKDIENEGMVGHSLEKFLKLSIFKYDGRIFQDMDFSIAPIKQIRDANLVDCSFDQEPQDHGKVLAGLLDDSEILISKAASRDEITPFYLFGEEGLMKSSFYKNDNQVGIKTQVVDQMKEKIIDVFDINYVEPDHLCDRYHFLISQNSQPDQLHKYFTITTVQPNVFSHMLHEQALKTLSYNKHFQISYTLYKSSVIQEENSQAIDSNLNSSIFIKDDNSKRGTFVKLKLGNPVAVRVGSLFMSNSNLGLYVKRISDQPITGKDLHLEPVSQAYEIICVNATKPEKSQIRQIMTQIEGSDAILERKLYGLQRLEYEKMLQNQNIPHILLQVIRWNEYMEYYEEIGSIYMIYIPQDHNLSENKLLKLSCGVRNQINLNEASRVIQRVIPRNQLDFDISAGYDSSEKLWYLCPTDEQFDWNSHEMRFFETYCTNIERDAKNQESGKIKRGLNLLSGMRESTERGVWMSISQFDILQKKFQGGWVEVGSGSLIKANDTIFKANIEELFCI